MFRYMFSFLEGKKIEACNNLITKCIFNSAFIYSPNGYLVPTLCPVLCKEEYPNR